MIIRASQPIHPSSQIIPSSPKPLLNQTAMTDLNIKNSLLKENARGLSNCSISISTDMSPTWKVQKVLKITKYKVTRPSNCIAIRNSMNNWP